MKVGILTCGLKLDTRAGIAKSRELGAHGVQLWVVDNDMDPRELTPSGRRELRALVESKGLEIAALCGDIGGFADPATVDERIARTRTMFDLCVDLGTPVLTTHIGVVPEDTAGAAYGALVDAVREVAKAGAERGCCFATETGPESGAALAGFLAQVNSEGAKANYDPANLCMMGFDPIQGVHDLKDYIVHTHAKDGNAPPHEEGDPFPEQPLGQGDVDFGLYLAALRDIGYTGFLTIEREAGDDRIGDIGRAVTFLKSFEGVEA